MFASPHPCALLLLLHQHDGDIGRRSLPVTRACVCDVSVFCLLPGTGEPSLRQQRPAGLWGNAASALGQQWPCGPVLLHPNARGDRRSSHLEAFKAGACSVSSQLSRSGKVAATGMKTSELICVFMAVCRLIVAMCACESSRQLQLLMLMLGLLADPHTPPLWVPCFSCCRLRHEAAASSR